MEIKNPYREIPISFDGNWSLEEKEPIIQIVINNDEDLFAYSFYNCWTFIKKQDGSVVGKRLMSESLWGDGRIYSDTISGIISQLEEYDKRDV